ncbi:MAG: response regulator [Candidatus Methanoperedens sp.]|nr:response regulator [Candidatus Methanoperedens sp.]
MTKIQILVVEDEAIVAEAIRRKLLKMGYDAPSTASSGEEAIKRVKENKPDLVLMDIVIQGKMDGIETAEHIRTRFNIPVVYLTAYSDEKTLLRAKITKPSGYIIKPFKERELQVAIEIALFKHDVDRKSKEMNEWFSTTLNSISDGVIATDPDGLVFFMNLVAQSMTGWKLEEAQRKPLKDIFNISTRIDGQQANRTVLISYDGSSTPIETSSNAIKDNNGNIIGVVMVFRPTREHKQ